jgi:hypothetical protein
MAAVLALAGDAPQGRFAPQRPELDPARSNRDNKRASHGPFS